MHAMTKGECSDGFLGIDTFPIFNLSGDDDDVVIAKCDSYIKHMNMVSC